MPKDTARSYKRYKFLRYILFIRCYKINVESLPNFIYATGFVSTLKATISLKPIKDAVRHLFWFQRLKSGSGVYQLMLADKEPNEKPPNPLRIRRFSHINCKYILNNIKSSYLRFLVNHRRFELKDTSAKSCYLHRLR